MPRARRMGLPLAFLVGISLVSDIIAVKCPSFTPCAGLKARFFTSLELDTGLEEGRCLCGEALSFFEPDKQIPNWDAGRTCRTELGHACKEWVTTEVGAFEWVKSHCCSKPPSPFETSDCTTLSAKAPTNSSYAVRYEGYVTMPEWTSDDFDFHFGPTNVMPDERIRMWLDNSLIVDQWSSLMSSSFTQMTVISSGHSLKPHGTYKIKVELQRTRTGSSDGSAVAFEWSSPVPPSSPSGYVPGTAFSTSGTDPWNPVSTVECSRACITTIPYSSPDSVETTWMGEKLERKFPVRVSAKCASTDWEEMACHAVPTNSTSLRIDITKGMAYQCCTGGNCFKEHAALRSLNLYPTPAYCATDKAHSCTAPVAEAYKCRHYSAFEAADEYFMEFEGIPPRTYEVVDAQDECMSALLLHSTRASFFQGNISSCMSLACGDDDLGNC